MKSQIGCFKTCIKVRCFFFPPSAASRAPAKSELFTYAHKFVAWEVSLRRVLYFRPDNLLHDFSDVEFIKIEIRISDRNLFGYSLNRLSALFVIKNRENGFLPPSRLRGLSGRRVNVQRRVTWIYIWSLLVKQSGEKGSRAVFWEKLLHETLYERNENRRGIRCI
jgi:hypothetical protein